MSGRKMSFGDVFGKTKPVIAMLHLKGDKKQSILERAKNETEIYFRNGVDAVLVENYSYGSTPDDCEEVLKYLQQEWPERLYGVNILGDYEYAFTLAQKYDAKFIQIDSVSGHLPAYEDAEFADRINDLRSQFSGIILGGVRFKYKPVRSGRSLEEDLIEGVDRCDAIVVTGEATGKQTPMTKMKKFRTYLPDSFPLIVGAGMTPDFLEKTLSICDGYIVGSYFKEHHIDREDVCEQNVQDFIGEKRRCQCIAALGSTADIQHFEREYAFLSMKAPDEITVGENTFQNVAAAYYAVSVPEELRAQFSDLDARKARKLFRELPHLEQNDELIKARLYEVVKAKYVQNPVARRELLETGSSRIIYDTSGSHDNVLGRCQCPECRGREYQNLYGKVLMQVRDELSQNV